MRILYVISELTIGGAEKQLVEIARQMAARGHDVAIYTLNSDVTRESELAGSTVTLIVDQKRSKFDWAVMKRLRRTMVEWDADVVHGFLFDGNFYARVAACFTGIPVLNSERSSDYRLSPLQAVAHRLTRFLARGVVANSHAGRDFALRLFGLAAENVHVVWNGLRLDELERQAAAGSDCCRSLFGDGAYRVACLVGAIKPGKDYHLALAVAAHLVRDYADWRVLFVGDNVAAPAGYKAGPRSDTGDYKEEVMRHYRDLKLEDKIKFAGRRDDVPAILRQCDVLFVTSVREGFPNVVLEAMGVGVPVVSTEYSDIRRILPFPWQVVEGRAPGEIARTIVHVWNRSDLVAQAQRDWVLANATIDQSASGLEQVYAKYIKPAPRTQTA